MQLPRRFAVPVVGLLIVALTSACAAQTADTSEPPIPSSVPRTSAAPTIDTAARDAYSAAICPIFTGIVELDPRLAEMRRAGAAGGDMTEHSAEISAITGELLILLEELEAVPEWTSGASLRNQLINGLHGIRAQLLHVAGDPAARGAADDLENLPYLATAAMDLAMDQAVAGGLTCEPAS